MNRTPGDGGPEDRIIDLAGRNAPSRDLMIEQVGAYWESVRRGRLVPQRIEIDPKRLEGCLGHVFLIERIAAGLARFRIAGSHMIELMGLEVRGLPLSSAFAPQSRESLSDAVQSLFDDPAVIEFALTSEGGFGRPELSGKMHLYPLRSDLGEISRALGVISMNGAPGRAPRRLTIARQDRRGLVGYAGDESGSLKGFRDPPVSTFRETADEPMKSGQAQRPSHIPPYLRLVTDNT